MPTARTATVSCGYICMTKLYTEVISWMNYWCLHKVTINTYSLPRDWAPPGIIWLRKNICKARPYPCIPENVHLNWRVQAIHSGKHMQCSLTDLKAVNLMHFYLHKPSRSCDQTVRHVRVNLVPSHGSWTMSATGSSHHSEHCSPEYAVNSWLSKLIQTEMSMSNPEVPSFSSEQIQWLLTAFLRAIKAWDLIFT